jgi:hypothetical protein
MLGVTRSENLLAAFEGKALLEKCAKLQEEVNAQKIARTSVQRDY